MEILQKYESAVFHGLGINSISAWNHKFLWKYQDYLLWISTFSYSGKKHWLENCKSLRIYIATAEAQSINGLPVLSFIPKINLRWDLLKSKYISTTSLVRLRLNSKELLLNWPYVPVLILAFHKIWPHISTRSTVDRWTFVILTYIMLSELC